MRRYGVVSSMKDFYWDIRPKPEYGTVEIRVFDTPLTVERAARIAVYAQCIAAYLLAEHPVVPSRDVYMLYNYNRFQACRYGLDGTVVDAYSEQSIVLRDDIMSTLRRIAPHARHPGNADALGYIAADVEAGRTDAEWLRATRKTFGSMNDVAREQSTLWMES
jgi:carboxylate-amine ligase